jgi:hypothetical protein
MSKILKVLNSILAILIPQLKNPEALFGIKETKEALEAFNEIGLFVASQIKDGVGVEDALALYSKIVSDEAFKSIIVNAYDRYDQIPAEIKDIDMGEGLELAKVQMDYVDKYLETFNV